MFTPDHPQQPDSVGVFINSGKVVVRKIQLKRIVSRAYGVEPAQITGDPKVQRFMSQMHYDIQTTIPESVGQKQVRDISA